MELRVEAAIFNMSVFISILILQKKIFQILSKSKTFLELKKQINGKLIEFIFGNKNVQKLDDDFCKLEYFKEYYTFSGVCNSTQVTNLKNEFKNSLKGFFPNLNRGLIAAPLIICLAKLKEYLPNNRAKIIATVTGTIIGYGLSITFEPTITLLEKKLILLQTRFAETTRHFVFRQTYPFYKHLTFIEKKENRYIKIGVKELCRLMSPSKSQELSYESFYSAITKKGETTWEEKVKIFLLEIQTSLAVYPADKAMMNTELLELKKLFKPISKTDSQKLLNYIYGNFLDGKIYKNREICVEFGTSITFRIRPAYLIVLITYYY
jgi:hypothetical protein